MGSRGETDGFQKTGRRCKRRPKVMGGNNVRQERDAPGLEAAQGGDWIARGVAHRSTPSATRISAHIAALVGTANSSARMLTARPAARSRPAAERRERPMKRKRGRSCRGSYEREIACLAWVGHDQRQQPAKERQRGTGVAEQGKAFQGLLTLLLLGGGYLYFTGRLDPLIGRIQHAGGPELPKAETGLIDMATDFAARYRDAPNDIVRARVPGERDAAICTDLPRTVTNWVGKLDDVQLTIGKKGAIDMRLSRHVSLHTWNNELSDIGDRTLISPDTPLAAKLETLKVGDTYVFDGAFVQSSESCLKEMSVTAAGGARDPDFLFRFTDIRPAR